MNLGFLGGTGIEGKGLSLRFAAAGIPVVIGSRSLERAAAAAEQCNALTRGNAARGMVNREMLACSDLVFLTVPFDRAATAVIEVREHLKRGTILVDVSVPVMFRQGRIEFVAQEGVSNSEAIARHVPEGVEIVAAFKTLPAHILADLSETLHCDDFVCGDSNAAKETACEAMRMIPSLRPLDAGPLESARAVERMAALAIALNRRYKKKGARFLAVGI
jgi:NADPH-dependent F420 reductase